MNHIVRARELCRMIPILKKLQDEKRNFDTYAAHRNRLSNRATMLAGLADIADELGKRGAEDIGFKRSAQGLMAKTHQIAEVFHEDKNVIIAPESEPTFWKPLEAMPKKVCEALEKEWESYVESKIPPSQAGILEILSKVRGFSDQAGTVRGLFAEIRAMGNSLPKEGDFERLDALTVRVKQAWNDLHGDGMPSQVLDFLKKAHTSGFSLTDLNNDVLDWLKKKNLLGQYAIRSK